MSSAPSSSSRTCASASSGVYFGAKRRFTVMVQRSGTTLCLPCDAALDADHLERLAELEAVDVDDVGLVLGEAREHLRRAVDGVAAHPRARRRGARLAVESGLRHEHALAAGLDPPVGGLEQDREVGRRAARAARRTRMPSPLNSSRDLFGFVEHEGHVVAGRRTRRRAAPRRGAAAPRGRPSCRRSRGRAARRRRRRGTSLPRWRARCRGGRRARRGGRGRAAVRTITLCADAVDGERRAHARAGAPRRDRRARPRGGSPTAPRPARSVSPKRSVASRRAPRTRLVTSRRRGRAGCR